MEKVMARLRGSADGNETDKMGELSVGDEPEKTVSKCKLTPLLHDLVARNKSTAGSLSLSIAPACEAVTLGVDGVRLEAVLQHLLQNAIEAAGSDGFIAIFVRDQDGRIIIEVQDNGPGMEAQFVENELFTPFRTTKTGGFGIGAYQCRALAREMRGELEVISAPGAGTTMRLTIPEANSESIPREAECHG
jgi:signal transduction histidine kinase